MGSLALSLVALAIGTAAIWWGSGWLESSAGRLARHYRLPAVVQGTLVVAVGSSFPELATTVTSTLIHGELELGVAAIVGSAIFNILVIPGISGLAAGGATHGLRLVYRDAQFYLTSVAVLLLTFSFALIYHPVPGSGDGRLAGVMTRPIAAVPLLLYGLYLFLQQQDTAEHRRDEDGDPGAATTDSDRPVRAGREWIRLAVALVVIVAGVEGLVRAVLHLGERFGVPSFLWGVTIVAAATSLPDALVSYRAANEGDAEVSLGNVLGSNVFDLLVAIPAGVLIAGPTPVDFAVAAPLMGMLTVATIVLFAAMRTGVVLSRAESWLLLALYALFVAWAAAESFGVVSWVAADRSPVG